MNLEKLNSTKFEAFKNNEMSNLFAIVGGWCADTQSAGVSTDSFSDATSTEFASEKHYSQAVGKYVDFYTTACGIGPSEGQGTLVRTDPNGDGMPPYTWTTAYYVTGSDTIPHEHF